MLVSQPITLVGLSAFRPLEITTDFSGLDELIALSVNMDPHDL